MGETLTKRGGRRVELFVPVTYAGVEIAAVDIAPVRLDHVVRWGEGKLSGSLVLLAELSGLQEGALRAITYPDVDRVMAAFMALLPVEILTDVNRGAMRMTGAPAPATPPPTAEAPEDTGLGFDMGERA